MLAALLAAAALTARPLRAQEPLAADTAGLPPAGYGTLRQDDVAIKLRTPTLLLRVMPLDERVIRLLSPDNYEALRRLREARSAEIASRAERAHLDRPTLFVVTFFGLQDRARFDPEVLTITSQNRFFRPEEIIPLTPLWSGQQLNQRETANAIYLYAAGIQLLDPFTVTYEGVTTDQWEEIIRRLDRERASVLARAAAGRRPP